MRDSDRTAIGTNEELSVILTAAERSNQITDGCGQRQENLKSAELPMMAEWRSESQEK
jgi:hypothetical protein